MRIGLDAMGGDYAPQSPIDGALAMRPWLEKAGHTLVLYGPESLLSETAAGKGALDGPIEVVNCTVVIQMEDHPAFAMKQKPDSSIAVGLRHLSEGKLDAYISAGSTGAVTVGSIQLLKLFPGLHRPVIGGVYPVNGQFSYVLDCGANTDSKPEYLVEFAYIGHAYMKALYGIENPRIGLLNIGGEPTKGNLLVKETYALLQKHTHTLNFVGNCEGWDLNQHKADVYVCDGFTGNILMKLVESMYPYLKSILPASEQLELLNFERIAGVPLLGVQGNVLIGHGNCSPTGFRYLVDCAIELIDSQLVKTLPELVANIWSAEAADNAGQ